MRTEKEIIDNVIAVANNDSNVKAVIQTDLLPVKEYLDKYSFYFIVDDVEKYSYDAAFENCLGDRILLYRGDKNYPEMFPNTKAHLMVFSGGETIVINAIDKDTFLDKYNGECKYDNVWIGDTFKKILDKENILPDIDRLEEKQTLFSGSPTDEEFKGSCQEFWWVLKTFAEYTLRKELPSAMFYLNMPVRDLLNQMLRWFIYLEKKCPVDMGILDSNFEKLLDEEYFALYKKTYPKAEYESIWEAYDAVVELWKKISGIVAKQCGYCYDEITERKMISFIQNLRDGSNKMICPVCGNNTFDEDDFEYMICPECYWEYDVLQVQEPDYAGGANCHSLNEYRKIYWNLKKENSNSNRQ